MNQVTIAHREAKTMSDKVALIAVKILRWGLDKATGYKHQKAVDVDAKDPLAKRKAFAMNEEKYLTGTSFWKVLLACPAW